jgi:uncharacterized membrane protein
VAFCPNCGAQVAGSFCPNCGTQVAGSPGAGTSAGSTAGYTSAPPPPIGAQAGGLTGNGASALCYTPFFIGLICDIIFLVASPYNRDRNVRFNAFQSLFLHAALFVFWIVVHMIFGVFALATHGFGLLLAAGFYPLLWLCILALFLVLMYKAYNNQKVKLPVIGDLAEKQA